MNDSRRKSKRNFWNKFQSSTKNNIWYFTLYIILIAMIIYLFCYTDSTNKYYEEALFFFMTFTILQIIAMNTGLYEKPEANKFFNSIKAIDIYTHILGGLGFYFYLLVVFNLDPSNLILITFFLTIAFEIIEYTFESINKRFNKKLQIKKSYAKYISEPLPNIIQDLISNLIGIMIGFGYIYLNFNF